MDLSFPLNNSVRPTIRSGGMAALLATAGKHQDMSTTALIARDLTASYPANPWMASEAGAFSTATAAALTRWKQL